MLLGKLVGPDKLELLGTLVGLAQWEQQDKQVLQGQPGLSGQPDRQALSVPLEQLEAQVPPGVLAQRGVLVQRGNAVQPERRVILDIPDIVAQLVLLGLLGLLGQLVLLV